MKSFFIKELLHINIRKKGMPKCDMIIKLGFGHINKLIGRCPTAQIFIYKNKKNWVDKVIKQLNFLEFDTAGIDEKFFDRFGDLIKIDLRKRARIQYKPKWVNTKIKQEFLSNDKVWLHYNIITRECKDVQNT